MEDAYKQYLKGFFAIFSALLCLLLIFTVGVDPFASFHSIAIPRFNAVKTNVHENMRLYKANRMLEVKPTGIILGSSRDMAGIDPEDLTAITGDVSYNCGIASPTFEETYKYFLHALYVQPELKTVILGIDIFSFNLFEKAKEDLPKFLYGEHSTILERLPAMFSFSALKVGFKTFRYNYTLSPLDVFLKNGLFNPVTVANIEANPILPNEYGYIRDIHLEGMYRLFKINEENVKQFASLVSICKERNIDLKVFINPAQALYWEAMVQHGYWGEVENLKRMLADIYPLWDFGGFNAVTTQMRKCSENILYYECSHFRPLLGKVILDILFDRNESPIQFGYFLEPHSIDKSLLAMRKEREEWAKAFPEIVASFKNDLKVDETKLVAK